MKKRLNKKQTVAVSSLLFGMFFGAGNLIFPVHMGQLAGKNIWPALIGFIITAVGLPLLGVVALGISKSSGLQELSSRVGKKYGVFYTCALYLTIGPCFAIPRCATTSFTVGLSSMVGSDNKIALAVFSAFFFTAVIFFSLKPNGILTWIGKIINPAFLVFLCTLIVIALVNPAAAVSSVTPDESYAENTFFTGILEGYNTMDALSCLCFGVIVINVIRGLGIEDGEDIAKDTIKAGIFSCIVMAVIYVGITVVGAQSRGVFEISENGGIALSDICNYYLGTFGNIFLAFTVTLACLKTAIGLLTGASETFTKMFVKSPGYKFWVWLFGLFGFAVANVGLSSIISYAVPVLLFLCPLAVTLILLTLFAKHFGSDQIVYKTVTIATAIAAFFDLVNALPSGVITTLHLDILITFAENYIPLFSLGLGWIVPSIIGLIIGLILHVKKKSA